MWLYIMASGWNGTLYVGVTNSLSRRIAEHREGRGYDCVRRYGVVHLVYAERFERAVLAVLGRHPAKNVAIVSHGTVMALFVSRRAGVAPLPLWRGLGMPAVIVMTLPQLDLVEVVERV